jgi:hypothetical protein
MDKPWMLRMVITLDGKTAVGEADAPARGDIRRPRVAV